MCENAGREPEIRYFSSVGDFCYTGGRLNIPTLVVGPQGGNFHAADEFVEMETVSATTRILYGFLCRVTGRM